MAYRPSEAKRGYREDFQGPNLIPIMNLFIVIIPMLITMVVTVNLAMLHISIPAGGGDDSDTGSVAEESDNESPLRVIITPEAFTVREKDTDNKLLDEIEIKKEDGRYNLFQLDKVISDFRKKYPDKNVIEVLPDNSVKYETLLKTIDVCKYNKFVNVVYLTVQKETYQIN